MVFKKGDIVQIKSYKQLKDEYGTASSEYYTEFIPCDGHFVPNMKLLCGKSVILTPEDIKSSDGTKVRFNKGGYIYTQDMLTKVGEIKDFDKIKEEGFIHKTYSKKELEIAKDQMLNLVDIDKVTKIIAGSNRTDISKVKGVPQMLKTWAENKVLLFLMLGRKLKINKEIEIDMKPEDINEDVEVLRKSYPLEVYILDCFNRADIIKNEVSSAPQYFKQYFDIQPGMKLTKAMHKIFNNELFDIEMSKVVQKTKKAGKLVASIDPVDILLMSKNSSGWHSCHNICGSNNGHGCYAAGCYSYVEDESTIISYRCSTTESEYTFGKYKVNEISKSWRELIFMNKESFYFVASRQYPYDDESLTKQVRELLEGQIAEYFNMPNSFTILRSDDIPSKIVKNFNEHALHYNDVLLYTSKKYPIIYSKILTNQISPKDFPEMFNITVGHSVMCPVCGKNEIKSSGDIACKNCQNGRTSYDEF